MTAIDLSQVGQAVSFKHPESGANYMASWFGETVTIWARLDTTQGLQSDSLFNLRSRFKEACEPIKGQEPPFGWVQCICFTVSAETRAQAMFEGSQK